MVVSEVLATQSNLNMSWPAAVAPNGLQQPDVVAMLLIWQTRMTERRSNDPAAVIEVALPALKPLAHLLWFSRWHLDKQEWRRRKGIDTLLEQPQPAFDFGKNMYAHGVACFTKGGQPVWVDKIADLKRTFAEFKVGQIFLQTLTTCMRSTCSDVQQSAHLIAKTALHCGHADPIALGTQGLLGCNWWKNIGT